jgi:hypothetical protein
MTSRALSSRIGSGLVALIAAIASYSHMRAVALSYGQTHLIATLMPLSVDGLVLVGAVAIGDGRRHTWSAWLAFWSGVGASIAANVLAARPDVVARIISAWPAVALLLVVEVITGAARGAIPVSGPVAGVPSPVVPPAVPVAEAPLSEPTPALVAPDSEHAQVKAARGSGNAEIVRRAAARAPDASIADLVKVTGLSRATVRRYRGVEHAHDEMATRVNGVPVGTP